MTSRNFRCLIYGEYFPGSLIEKTGFVGFYVTRYVKAETEDLAEIQAVKELQSEDLFKVAFVEQVDLSLAKVFLDEIEEVPEIPLGPKSGYAWFSMDTADKHYSAINLAMFRSRYLTRERRAASLRAWLRVALANQRPKPFPAPDCMPVPGLAPAKA